MVRQFLSCPAHRHILLRNRLSAKNCRKHIQYQGNSGLTKEGYSGNRGGGRFRKIWYYEALLQQTTMDHLSKAITRQEFVPPKPAELHNAFLGGRSTVCFTMLSRADLSSGVRKLMFAAINPC